MECEKMKDQGFFDWSFVINSILNCQEPEQDPIHVGEKGIGEAIILDQQNGLNIGHVGC